MLNFSFPQAVDVAISIDSYCFIVSQEEGDMGFITGLQNLTLTTVFGLDIDPLDEMLRKHRMIYRTHIDMDCTIFNSNSRQMLFAAGFYGVRLKSLHFLTTTHHGNTCVMNHTNQIAAMTADIKFYVHSYSPLHDLFLLQNLGLFIRELIFSYAAQRALKILGKVFPFCAGCNSIVRITDSFIINPTAYITYIFHKHFLLVNN